MQIAERAASFSSPSNSPSTFPLPSFHLAVIRVFTSTSNKHLSFPFSFSLYILISFQLLNSVFFPSHSLCARARAPSIDSDDGRMSRATRWLRHLWSSSSSKENKETKTHGGEERMEKKRWSFRRSKDSGDAILGQNASTAAGIEAAWLQSYAASQEEQSKHAIAVAAATAVAADAAVAAARAAVAAMRLTTQGNYASCARARAAAAKIQTAFRGYLARKALRALKALVKLQALARGYLVRKKTAASLHRMQALVRAQAAVRAQRSFERLSTSLDSFTRIVEIDTCRRTSRPSHRISPSVSSSADEHPLQAISSRTPSQIPAPISIPVRRRNGGEKCWLPATAHSTPRYMSFSGDEAVTPARSACVEEGVFRQYLNVSSSPKYMANTQSSTAKQWTQSGPKQQPSESCGGARRRQPLGEINVQAKDNSSGVGMQKPCTWVAEGFSFKRAVVGRLDRASEVGKGAAREVYLQRKW